MSYHLGIDLGTTFVAAAAASGSGIEMITLGDRTVVAPAVVYGGEDGGLVFGEAALQRALSHPERLQRDLKRSLGGRVDVLLGPTSYPVTELLAGMLADVVHTVTEQRGTKPDSVMLTHPANYREFRCELFAQVAAAADLSTAQTVTEPAAAAVHYATRRPLADGECLAVYDLGGGTFDATVVQNQGGSIVILAQDGIERLGGVDFDDALWQHCVVASHGALAELDFRDRPTTIAVGQLRQHISAAKEALSRDTEATIPVFLPDRNFLVTVTRAQFEDMIRASIDVDDRHPYAHPARGADHPRPAVRGAARRRILPHPAGAADAVRAARAAHRGRRAPEVRRRPRRRPTGPRGRGRTTTPPAAADQRRPRADHGVRAGPPATGHRTSPRPRGPIPRRPRPRSPRPRPPSRPPSAPAGRPATDTGSLPLFGGYQGEEPGHDPGYDPGDDTDADATIAYGSAAPATAAGPSRSGGSSVPPTPTAVAEHPAPGNTGHPSDSPSPPLGGARPRPGRSRSRLVTAVAVLMVVLVVLGWLTYTVVRPAASTPPTPAGVAGGAPRPVDPGPAAVAAPEQSQSRARRRRRRSAADRRRSGLECPGSLPGPDDLSRRHPRLRGGVPERPACVCGEPGREPGPDQRHGHRGGHRGQPGDRHDPGTRRTGAVPGVLPGRPHHLCLHLEPGATIAAVGVLDTTTNTITATIPVRTRPFLAAVTPDGRQLYVPNHDSGSVSVIDTATTTVTDDIKVAANPHWVEFSTDGRFAYTANHESNLVSILDVSTHSVIAEVPVGKSPHSVAVHPTRPLVANVNYDDASVTFLNTEDRGVETIRVGDNPQDITWAPDGRFAYTTNVNDNSVSVINAETKTVTASIPTGDSPTSIAVLPNGRAAYVTNLGDGTLTVLNTGH